MRLVAAHRVLGLSVLLFLVFHFANHAALVFGTDTHLTVQGLLRIVYRHPLVEPVLIAAFLVQTGLGVYLLIERGWPRRLALQIQTISGLLIAAFVLQHVSAVFATRYFEPEIDTTVYWAASVVSRPDYAAYFVPYYVLGVAALFVHLGAYVVIRKRAKFAGQVIAICGSVFAVVLVALLAGTFYEINLPSAYVEYLDNSWF